MGWKTGGGGGGIDYDSLTVTYETASTTITGEGYILSFGALPNVSMGYDDGGFSGSPNLYVNTSAVVDINKDGSNFITEVLIDGGQVDRGNLGKGAAQSGVATAANIDGPIPFDSSVELNQDSYAIIGLK